MGHWELVLGTEISPIASVLPLVSPHWPAWPLWWGHPFSWERGLGFQPPRPQVHSKFGKSAMATPALCSPVRPCVCRGGCPAWSPGHPRGWKWQGSHWGLSWKQGIMRRPHDWCLAGMNPTPSQPWPMVLGTAFLFLGPWPTWLVPLSFCSEIRFLRPARAQPDCQARNWPLSPRGQHHLPGLRGPTAPA